jgi:hypothetical protein
MVLELLFNKTRDLGHQMTLIELATSFFTDMFSSKMPSPNDCSRREAYSRLVEKMVDFNI